MRKEITNDLLEMDPGQEDFIRLLREKAEDTPVPMALEPSMMMARLEAQTAKKKTSWLKVLSPVAMAVTACFAMVLAGRSGDLDATVPSVSAPSSQIEVSSEPSSEAEVPVDVSEPSSEVEEPSSEVIEPSSEPALEPSEPVSDETPSADAVVPEPSVPDEQPSSEPAAGDTSVSDTPVSDTSVSDTPVSDAPAADVPVSAPSAAPDANIPEYSAPMQSGPLGGMYVTSDNAYSDVYRALQAAATPENAQGRYATRVLSAGISADGLQISNEKAIVCEGKGYFYVSHQNSTEVTVVGADGSCSSFVVEFNTPEFAGLTVSSSVITHCEVINGRLFAAGTVSYERGGVSARTVSAVSCYDLSDPASPRRISGTAQDGTMIGLKEIDGYLYLFSRYYPDSAATMDRVEAYIPAYYGTEAKLIAAGDIAVSDYRSDSYIVATAYSSKSPSAPCDVFALQGGGDSYFLGENGLYLFGDQLSFGSTLTEISSLQCRRGSVGLVGEAVVPGVLNHSDSPNEYNGNLRVLTTSYGGGNATNLFIFDRDLELLGSKEGFAANKILRSVRFERSKLYFSLYEDRSATYALDLLTPQSLGDVYQAERSEEALKAVMAGSRTLRLSGALGRGSLTLALKDDTDLIEKKTIALSGSYNEGNVSLQTYDQGRYAAVIYTDSGTQKQTVRFYAVEKDGLREIITYECSVWYGGVRAYLQDGRFYVVSFAETVAFDAADGSLISTIEY